MSAEEFMKQQYLTLRDEIRASKARVFMLLVLGTLFVPAVFFAAQAFESAFASAALPFVLLVLMLAFVMEQNGILRAGKYLKDHVEPHIEGQVTWESWLESNHKHRDMDRYFFVSFLLVFLLFYAIGASLAVVSISQYWPEDYWYTAIGYTVGGLWFIIVWLRHWHSCMSTD